MTLVYFVRHAQPLRGAFEDRLRPLTDEGKADCAKVCDTLRDISLDFAISSPYLRSCDTISECVREHGLAMHTDERFRERKSGPKGNSDESLFKRRWSDFSWHEDGGECLGDVQKRNIDALFEVLDAHSGENIIIGTHGTALAAILNFFDPFFGCENFFMEIIDNMPYIIRLDFDGHICTAKQQLLAVYKEFKK